MGRLFLIATLLLWGFNAQAVTWRTIAAGQWYSGVVWDVGVAPAFTSNDTIFIDHYVQIGAPVQMQQGGLLKINVAGSVCGHQYIKVGPGAALHVHGLLELDSLLIAGGYLYATSTAYLIQTYIARFYNGGSGWQSCRWKVGPWFDCMKSAKDWRVSVADVPEVPAVNVRRHGGGFFLRCPGVPSGSVLRIWDSSGRLILQRAVRKEEEQFEWPSDAPAGLLYWRLEGPGGVYSGKLAARP